MIKGYLWFITLSDLASTRFRITKIDAKTCLENFSHWINEEENIIFLTPVRDLCDVEGTKQFSIRSVF